MRNTLIFLTIILLHINVVAQDKLFPKDYPHPDIVNKVLNDLTLYGKENFYNLIPFEQNEKWGFLDKNTLQIVVKPIANRVAFYQDNDQNILVEINHNKESFGIMQRNGKLKIITLGPPQVVDEKPIPHYVRSTNLKAKIVSSENGYKGFTYTKNDEDEYYISSYSDLYKSSSMLFPGLSLIEMEGKVYGIAKKNNEKSHQSLYAIIDENGNPLKNFDFHYNNIIPLTGYNKNLGHWFLVLKEGSENFQLKNSNGELLTYDGTTEANFLLGFYSMQNKDPYYTASERNLNYVLMNNRIFDTYNLKWIKTKIPSSYKLLNLSYLLPNKPQKNELAALRQNAEFYVWVENTYGESFYIDFDGKEYIPKKN